MRRFCGCPCLPVRGWLWRLICWRSVRRGEKRRFTVVFSSFPLFFRSSSLCLCPSPSVVYSAALLALWLWLDLCGSGGAGCLLAVLSPPPLSCWLWLFWRSASGFDLWAALPLVLSPCLSPSVSTSAAGASSAPVLSEGVQAFPCPVLRRSAGAGLGDDAGQ